MNHEIDLKNYTFRTDLIIETLAGFKERSGILETSQQFGEITLDEIEITAEGEKNCGKKKGLYKTITFQDVTDHCNRKKVEEVFVLALRKILEDSHIPEEATCLVIGLGNVSSTPDALGPKVMDHLLVTKHLFDLPGSNVEEGYRNVCAFAPGVTGITGIETSDMILGVVDKIHPDFIIAVDALASSSVDRVNKTIQMTDTGIHPGSGVGNSRREISKETIGIPVLAIGVPTVVDAVTIVSDTIHYMLQQFSYNKENMNVPKEKLVLASRRNYLNHSEQLTQEEKTKLMGLVGTLSVEEMKKLVFEVLTPIGYNLMVTPKEVDFLIEKLSLLIGKGMNAALHRQINS